MLYVSYIHLSHTLTIFKFITCAYWVSSAWHEADPHYADLVSVGIGSQPHSPPPVQVNDSPQLASFLPSDPVLDFQKTGMGATHIRNFF